MGVEEDPAAHDLKKATDLMKAAGMENGFDAEFIWASSGPDADQIAEILKQQLAKIKVNLNLKPMETAAYYNQIYTYKYDMASHTTTSTPDPDEALSAYYGPTSTYYKYYGKDNGIWDAIDAQSQELDQPSASSWCSTSEEDRRAVPGRVHQQSTPPKLHRPEGEGLVLLDRRIQPSCRQPLD
ncbi:MAG: ABC transporter substrate-binding protein [Dehalococcoidia bacterium]